MSYEVVIKAYGTAGETLWGSVKGGTVPTGPDAQQNALMLGQTILSQAREAIADIAGQVASESPLLSVEQERFEDGMCPAGCGHMWGMHDGGGCAVVGCPCGEANVQGEGA